MKSIALVALVLCTSAFAAQPKSTVTAGGMAGYSNVRITGPAAKKIFLAMEDVKNTIVKRGSSVLTIKQGAQIRCSSSYSVKPTASCTFGVNSKGDVTAALARENGKETDTDASFVEAGGMASYSNVRIQGDAAESIFGAMIDAKQTPNGRVAMGVTTRASGDISCRISNGATRMATCQFSVDSKGRVNANLAR